MLEQDIRSICQWKDVEVLELNIKNDHVHMIVSIPPRVSVSDFMGILKGKKPYWGNHFWARGYFVNTIGINEEMICRYVKYQENKERDEEKDRTDFTLF
jgi:putative transposase